MIQILYVDFDVVHPKTFVYDDYSDHDWWLIIQTITPSEFLIDNKWLTFPEHTTVISPPHSKIFYRACSESYGNHWIRFYADELFITETPLPLSTPFLVTDPDFCRQLFCLLAIENLFDNKLRSYSIDYLLRLLVNKYIESYDSALSSTMVPNSNLLALRQDIFLSPNHPWTATSMAERLHVSVSYLHTIYREAFGTTCIEDVINQRIVLAKEHLHHSIYSIKEIAICCGYQNVEHFSRQFKKIVGCSPKEYRENLRNSNNNL